jgi:hypothetical protein
MQKLEPDIEETETKWETGSSQSESPTVSDTDEYESGHGFTDRPGTCWEIGDLINSQIRSFILKVNQKKTSHSFFFVDLISI